jgi:hypothetical protein
MTSTVMHHRLTVQAWFTNETNGTPSPSSQWT